MTEKSSTASEALTADLQMEAEEILSEVLERFPKYRDRLEGTTVRLSGRLTSSAGNACPQRRQIGLSLPIFSLTENRGEFRNTVLHELAHIIAGPKARAHGSEWKSIFLELGGNGKRTHQMRARGRHRRHPVQCEKCNESLEVSTRLRNSIAKGKRDYLHVGCGGILICHEETDAETGGDGETTKPATGWIEELSKKWRQGTLFRFFSDT